MPTLFCCPETRLDLPHPLGSWNHTH